MPSLFCVEDVSRCSNASTFTQCELSQLQTKQLCRGALHIIASRDMFMIVGSYYFLFRPPVTVVPEGLLFYSWCFY